jgi:hypothetical protein
MTFRVTIGIDPGQTGAIAVLTDGICSALHDMPVMPRSAGGMQVNATALAAILRGVLHQHQGAFPVAVLEAVSAMPGNGGTSMFRFGQSYGIVIGVLGALGIGVVPAAPNVWKKHLNLTNKEKDVARTVAIERFPTVADQLTLKKHIGRADAILIALWAELTEQVPMRIAA